MYTFFIFHLVLSYFLLISVIFYYKQSVQKMNHRGFFVHFSKKNFKIFFTKLGYECRGNVGEN